MYTYTLLRFYIYTYNRVLKQGLTNSIIPRRWVTLVRIFLPVPCRHVCLLKGRAEKKLRRDKNGLVLR